MFERHFGLRENPFAAGHQSRFIYPSREHQEALAHLRFGIENREPFVLITGEVGTGKTTALYEALSEWQSRVAVALITNSALSRGELIEEICLRFGVPVVSGASKPQAMAQLERHLLGVHARDERAILLIDEAQNLDRPLLEEMRLLSNLEAGGDKLLQIFLVGQPELEGRLAQPELRQLRQRIAVHYRLRPLTVEETQHYIHHRISVSGGNAPQIFPSDSCREVYRLTHGIPREINTVAAQALINAFVEDLHSVRPYHVVAVAQETDFQSVVDDSRRTAPTGAPEAARPLAPAPATEGPPPATEFPPAPPLEPPRPVSAEPMPAAAETRLDPAASLERVARLLSATQVTPLPEATPLREAALPPPPAAPPAGVTPYLPPALGPAAPPTAPAGPPWPPATARPTTPTAGVTPLPGTPRPRAPRVTPTPAFVPPAAAPPTGGAIESGAAGVRAAVPPAVARPTLARRMREEQEKEDRTRRGPWRWLAWAAVALIVLVTAVVLIYRFAPWQEWLSGERGATQRAGPAIPSPAPGPTVATQPDTSGSALAPRDTTGARYATGLATTATVTPAGTSPAAAAPPVTTTPPVAGGPTATPFTRPAPPAVTLAPTASVASRDSLRSIYGIVVGNYLNEERAQAERTKLTASTSLPMRVSTVREGNVAMYRLTMGRFPSRVTAERAASDLIRRGLVDEARVVIVARVRATTERRP